MSQGHHQGLRIVYTGVRIDNYSQGNRPLIGAKNKVKMCAQCNISLVITATTSIDVGIRLAANG
jgi:hypothetical protein